MSIPLQAFVGARIFDGGTFLSGVVVADGQTVQGIVPAIPFGADVVTLDGGILAPGYVDLQVNGGGGVMMNDAPTVATLKVMAAAQAGLGTTCLLPTLITDTPEVTRAAVDAVADAVRLGVPGIAGLHLEGPHLSVVRKGAHDPALIRPMTSDDLAFLLDAAGRLPCLMVTVAPESVSDIQIAALAQAGVIVAIGHTDADFDTVMAAAGAGATVITHLYNAMRQLGNREPGVVGAALSHPGLSAGIIADGIHVHPAALQIALAAKQGPGAVFLVSDAMATAGSDIAAFTLNGRTIHRAAGRLTLADGTLAGADLDLSRALRVMVNDVGTDPAYALAMATRIPARIARLNQGVIAAGGPADLVHLSDDLHLHAVWQAGQRVAMSVARG